MAKVNWYLANRMLKDLHPNAVLLPFEESIEETAKETERTLESYPFIRSIVVVVGSGTIAAGILRGASRRKHVLTIYGVAGRDGDMQRKTMEIEKKAAPFFQRFMPRNVLFMMYNPKWEYTEKSEAKQLFPCHPYYDLKAWEWLCNNINQVTKPVLFWNVGAVAEEE